MTFSNGILFGFIDQKERKKVSSRILTSRILGLEYDDILMKQIKKMKLFHSKETCCKMTQKENNEVHVYIYMLTLNAMKSCHVVAGSILPSLEV